MSLTISPNYYDIVSIASFHDASNPQVLIVCKDYSGKICILSYNIVTNRYKQIYKRDTITGYSRLVECKLMISSDDRYCLLLISNDFFVIIDQLTERVLKQDYIHFSRLCMLFFNCNNQNYFITATYLYNLNDTHLSPLPHQFFDNEHHNSFIHGYGLVKPSISPNQKMITYIDFTIPFAKITISRINEVLQIDQKNITTKTLTGIYLNRLCKKSYWFTNEILIYTGINSHSVYLIIINIVTDVIIKKTMYYFYNENYNDIIFTFQKCDNFLYAYNGNHVFIFDNNLEQINYIQKSIWMVCPHTNELIDKQFNLIKCNTFSLVCNYRYLQKYVQQQIKMMFLVKLFTDIPFHMLCFENIENISKWINLLVK